VVESEEQFRDRKRRTQSVLDLISERHGSSVARDWAWACTPIPCGLPSDEQLEDGLRLARGDTTIEALLRRGTDRP